LHPHEPLLKLLFHLVGHDRRWNVRQKEKIERLSKLIKREIDERWAQPTNSTRALYRRLFLLLPCRELSSRFASTPTTVDTCCATTQPPTCAVVDDDPGPSCYHHLMLSLSHNPTSVISWINV
jgi:hypothetical protein